MRGVSVAAAIAACGPGTPVTSTPAPVPPPVAQVPADAGASQEERLAAIQKAMNELDEAAQACWARSATERFDIEGRLVLGIEIEHASARVQVVSNATRNAALAECLVAVLTAYPWAPPLHGEAIQLPFQFRAPAGQSVIDRRLVTWREQDKLGIAVLLDEANTGNAAASMFEIALAAGGSTGPRQAERAELWYFLGPATVEHGHKGSANLIQNAGNKVGPGDMMYVPRGAVRDVTAEANDAHAVVVLIPGGREGTARAGALPTPAYSVQSAPPSPPRMLFAGSAKTYGPATIYMDASLVKDAPCSASVLALGADAKVPEHVHAGETELLYVLEGSGTMTVAGQTIAVSSSSVIQIPPNTKHAFAATSAVRAVQIYTPAGPEQRLKARP